MSIQWNLASAGILKEFEAVMKSGAAKDLMKNLAEATKASRKPGEGPGDDKTCGCKDEPSRSKSDENEILTSALKKTMDNL